MERLNGVVKNYAWGSSTMLSGLRGSPSTKLPEAELWFGTHPVAPSTLESGETLLARIEADPQRSLGVSVVERFGPRLPFLVKVLAAERPLSIQAHPSLKQARAGFAIEEAAGIDRSAPERSFRDDNHKPELICALTEFEALVGFRNPSATARYFAALGFSRLDSLLAAGGPKAAVSAVLDPESSVEDVDISDLVETFVDSCAAYTGAAWAAETTLIGRLAAQYPSDPGIVVAALLNYVVLKEGEALYLGAGNMHAYVGGLAVEIMANSDNVLRGGLTPKHIDVVNLLDVVVPDAIEPALVTTNAFGQFETPAPDFALTRHEDPSGTAVTGPAIVLGVEGTATIASGRTSIAIGPTEAVWVRFGDTVELRGRGVCFSATVGATS